MAGSDAVWGPDGRSDPGPSPRSGATAWPGESTRLAHTARPAGAPVTDEGRVHRHYQGAMRYLKNLADELDARGLAARGLWKPFLAPHPPPPPPPAPPHPTDHRFNP